MVSENPLVSVILPVYNGEEFVGCALESVILQTYSNLEIVVVDDGSTDGTQRVLRDYAARDSRIRVIYQANAGVARARNRAISESSGDFIAPIDADDLWAPHKIARQVKRIQAAGRETGLVYSWWAWIDATGKVLDRSPRWAIQGEALPQLVFINFIGSASVPLFRRHCLEEVGGYDETLAAAQAGGCEDWGVALRIAAKYRVAVVQEVLLGYRRRPGSMSSACDTMRRSQQLVMEDIRKLRPDLKPALCRASDNQFAMYLAGVSYWSGNLKAALQWTLRAGVQLPVFMSPHVARMYFRLRTRQQDSPVMRPGVKIDAALIPEPLLAYDQVVTLSGAVARWITGPVIGGVQSVICWAFRTRLRLEYRLSRGTANKKRERVWATACWHFPIYSQTFVYREILELMKGGFEVRFAYTGLAPRSELPDDATAVWNIRRRMPLYRFTADRDFSHYKRLMPQRIRDLVRRIADAADMTEEEVCNHRHFRQAFSFTRMAQAWHADYIHTYFFYEQGIYGLVASTLLDLPRGVSCYADHMMDDYELKVVGLQLRTCEVVVATSGRIKQELEGLAKGPLPAAIVKPNGIDTSQYGQTVRPRNTSRRVFKIVAVNRIHPKKGVAYLIEAAALLRQRELPFVIEVLGDCDANDPASVAYFEEMQQLVAAHVLEEQVTFRGRQTATEVRSHLAEADIFVAPFIELANGDKDGIPTALLEAMAAGCGVVVTDAGSIAEVVSDNVEGLVVPQRDALKLAEAIELLASDHTLRERLAHVGMERARQDFDVSRCEQIFHQAIRRAIERKAPFHPTGAAPIQGGGLRIGLLSFEYPPETGHGGIGTYTWYQARALARSGHRVHVLAGSREYLPMRTREHDGVIVHRYRGTELWMPLAAILGAFKCYWTRQRLENAWCMYLGMRQLMKHYEYDIIEMPECGAEGALITWLLRVPTVVRFHGPAGLIMPFYDVPAADRLMCPWIERIGITQASALTSCSQFLAEEVRTELGFEQRTEVIYNGIDLSLFDAEPDVRLEPMYGLNEGGITILFAGRMERRKGIHLCAAIAEIVLRRHDVTFLFAGDDLFVT